MLNLSNMFRSKQPFEVHLTRKQTANAGQNIRKRVEYVRAHDKFEAAELALKLPVNQSFRVASVREIR